MKIRIHIERGKTEPWLLFYATSPDIKGLLVAEPTRAALYAAVPKAIAALREASKLPSVGFDLEYEEDFI